jgi:hypothetical protein
MHAHQNPLRFFDASHLPAHLAEVVQPFAQLAAVVVTVPGPETTVCLRKLLEAKDCAVRAAIAAREAKA